MINLQQQTDLQIATECHPTTIQRKQDLPLRIPAPSRTPDWPQHVFPRQRDLARHIKRQRHERFRTSLSSEEAAKFNAKGRHTVTLHQRARLLTDRIPITQLWQCSTSLFSLTCFYELSNQAFINSTCLLFGIPLPHAIYLKATQPTYAQCDIWGDALLNKSTYAAEARKTTHTTCPGTNQNCKRVWSPYNLQRITPTISRRRHTKLLKKEGRFLQLTELIAASVRFWKGQQRKQHAPTRAVRVRAERNEGAPGSPTTLGRYGSELL